MHRPGADVSLFQHLAEPLDLLPGIGPGDGCTQGDDQDVAEGVLLGPVEAGGGQLGEGGGRGTGPGRRSWRSSVAVCRGGLTEVVAHHQTLPTERPEFRCVGPGMPMRRMNRSLGEKVLLSAGVHGGEQNGRGDAAGRRFGRKRRDERRAREARHGHHPGPHYHVAADIAAKRLRAALFIETSGGFSVGG
jgi:hypothetical protein